MIIIPSPAPRNTQSLRVHSCIRYPWGKDNRQRRDTNNPHSSTVHTNP
jgi:hypothetical protein